MARRFGGRGSPIQGLDLGVLVGEVVLASVEKVEAVWEFETSELFDEAERAALRVAFAAGQVPNQVTDQEMEDLVGYFSDAEVVEIVAAIAVFGFLNRWNDTMATTLESAPLAFADHHLEETGWDVGKHG